MCKLSLSEIKQCEFDILLNFDLICKEHRLKYYLAGGTLLGAIRHKGFIPWDDDIDICMPRKDYLRFIEIFKNCCNNEHLSIKSNILNNFDAPFAKIVDNRTIVDNKYSDENINKHLWIDILPVDGLPDDIEIVKKIYNQCDFYRKLLMLQDAKLGEGTTAIKKYCKYVLKPLACLYGKGKCIERIEELAAQYPYDECNYVGIITWGLYGSGERMPKEGFEKSIEVEFEGHKFPAFSCWDSYLTGLYGDYMQLPPVEKRKTHDIEVYWADESKG